MKTQFFWCVLAGWLMGTGTEAQTSEPLTRRIESFLESRSLKELSKSADFEQPLSAAAAKAVEDVLTTRWTKDKRQELKAEFDRRVVVEQGVEMPFFYKRFGKLPGPTPLYISLHGGGGTTPEVNNRQWENQKRLYEVENGVYCAPRAPGNTWDLWHRPPMDELLVRLALILHVFESIDLNRVYLLGYSAGGDGVFQIAPRLADRFAAAAMMAGHPNDARPDNLRNLPFTLHMGAQDSAYERNKRAAEWEEMLSKARAADAEGYVHLVRIHKDKGHWMDRLDAEALPWMSKFERNTVPRRLVWYQDDVVQKRFYWLESEDPQSGTLIHAQVEGQTILLSDGPKAPGRIFLRLSDRLLDLDQPIRVRRGDRTVFEGQVQRRVKDLAESLLLRGDRFLSAPARIGPF